jgi:hypothetical protein
MRAAHVVHVLEKGAVLESGPLASIRSFSGVADI